MAASVAASAGHAVVFGACVAVTLTITVWLARDAWHTRSRRSR
ncbi:hypothetical protein [Streptomyces yaizuensis]|nr:hypothetical protein [Streptomyces sp. YSPA8]